MSVLLLLLVLVVVFALSGVAGHFDSRFRKHGPHALAWRWFTASAELARQGGDEPGLDPAGHEGADADRARAPPLVPPPLAARPVAHPWTPL